MRMRNDLHVAVSVLLLLWIVCFDSVLCGLNLNLELSCLGLCSAVTGVSHTSSRSLSFTCLLIGCEAQLHISTSWQSQLRISNLTWKPVLRSTYSRQGSHCWTGMGE